MSGALGGLRSRPGRGGAAPAARGLAPVPAPRSPSTGSGGEGAKRLVRKAEEGVLGVQAAERRWEHQAGGKQAFGEKSKSLKAAEA